jgi:hypothetical protein
LFIGKNYRKEWTTPVKIPIFHLRDEQGGLTIIDSGGGRQTNNLRLKDKNDNQWILRSVDKDIEKSLIPGLGNTMVETVMQDLQSAIHPYAALTIPVPAEAIGVIAAEPHVFFIPDDPAFGDFRSIFANTVCFLEKREPTPDKSETKSSNTVLENVFKETDHRLLQKAMLKARLLDMLIADWDRHEDQWRWGVYGIVYHRKFHPQETKRIFIKGFGGNDQFTVDQNVSSSIRLYLDGGNGTDVYSLKGKIKTRIEESNKTAARPTLAQK